MKRLVMLAALLAAACQPLPSGEPGGIDHTGGQVVNEIQTTDVPPAVRVPADPAASDCIARGGRMEPQGRMQTLQCVVAYTDGGQRCTDGDQCQGDCRVEESAGLPRAGAAAVGRCQASSSRFGCYATVKDGRAQAAICVD